MALRCQIILAAAQGCANLQIAAQLDIHRHTVALWRKRVKAEGIAALWEIAPGRGRKPKIDLASRDHLIDATLQTKPKGQTHWSCRTMAKSQNISKSTVNRLWQLHNINKAGYRALQEGGRVDEGTSGYCQARARLPIDILARLRCCAAASAQKAAGLWRGLRPKVIDGTSTSFPDTAKNQKAYPQSSGQKPGCGFPLMKIVEVFCLGSGTLLDYAKGNKHQHELSLLQKIMDQFKKGDLALADRGFSSYALMGLLLSCSAFTTFFAFITPAPPICARANDWAKTIA